MFGYVKPDAQELRVREKQRYDAWYCGLCRQLGKSCGQAARALLSYDAAFLALLASSASGCAPGMKMRTCPVRPLGKKRPAVEGESPALEFAAKACVILAKFKLDDDVRDGKKLRAVLKPPFLRAFSRARRSAPELYGAIEAGLQKLTAIENSSEPSPDIAANAFGAAMRSVIKLAPGICGGENETALGELGFFIGRTVYLLDAWDDRAEDARSGSYNPFLLSETERSEAEYLVNFSINSAISAYDLVEPVGLRGCAVNAIDGSIVENVLRRGLFAAWDRVSEKSHESGGDHRIKERKKAQ